MIDTKTYLESKNRKYPVSFNLNVMEEIQEHYGSYEAWAQMTLQNGEPKIKDLKFGIMAMINEGIDIENEENNENNPFITSKQLGRLISDIGFGNVLEAVKDAQTKSTEASEDLSEKNM